MKKIITVLLLLVAGFLAKAQPTITLLTFESYTFPDKFDTEYGTGKEALISGFAKAKF